MKIRPVGAELFIAERRTDMTKLTVALRHFANSTKNDMLTLNLPKTTIVAQPFNVIKWQLKFNPVA